jgi:tRNA (cmo5U34)-methyltransferase
MATPNDNASAHPAHRYDAEIRPVIPFYDTIQSETLDLVRSVVRQPILWIDTGCGTGALVARALPLFPRTRFLLADPSTAMLAQARDRLAAAHADAVTILPAMTSDGLSSVVPKLRVQVVTAMLCHHYMEPTARLAAVRSCYEILEPGGVLIVVENVDGESMQGREIGLRRWGEYQLLAGREPEAVDQHLARFGAELKPIKITEHFAVFRQAGFTTPELFWRAHMQAGFYAVKG